MTLPALASYTGAALVEMAGSPPTGRDLTIGEINRLEPELTVLALDMPGRRNKPGDLREMTIADYVDSLVVDIQSTRPQELVLVGHSMEGITLPGVLAKLGAARVREIIFAAAFLPPVDTSIVESSPWVIRTVARRIATKNVPTPTPKLMARFSFLNGVPAHRRRFLSNKLHAESLRILTEKAFRANTARRHAAHLDLDSAGSRALAEGTAQIHRVTRRCAGPHRGRHLSHADGQRASAHRICLPKPSAVRYSALHSCEASQLVDSKQITASQREVLLNSWPFHRVPGCIPETGSVSRKISLASSRPLLPQPLLQRHRGPVIPPGMTQEYARHPPPLTGPHSIQLRLTLSHRHRPE